MVQVRVGAYHRGYDAVSIADMDDPILTSLHWQTAVSTRQQAIQSLNFERSSVPFSTINPQSGDFADIDGQLFVNSQIFGEETTRAAAHQRMNENIYPQITQIDAGFFCVFAPLREGIYIGGDDLI